jgi:hypothetical protein
MAMNANDLFGAVLQLDLEPVKTKLMHAASGERWSRAQADAVEKEYRRFLCLMKLHPDEAFAPTMDVDTFWHYHILDTLKYARDCTHAFGYFIHHDPHVGLEADDQDARSAGAERMRACYEALFGECYPGLIVEPDAAAARPPQRGNRHARRTGAAALAPRGAGRRIPTGFRIRGVCRPAGGAVTAYCAGPHIKAGAWRDGA